MQVFDIASMRRIAKATVKVEQIPWDMTAAKNKKTTTPTASTEYNGPFKLYVETIDSIAYPRIKAYKATTAGTPPVTTVTWAFHNYVFKQPNNFEVTTESIPAITLTASSTYIALATISGTTCSYSLVPLTNDISTQTDIPFRAILLGTFTTDATSKFTSVEQWHEGCIYIEPATFPCKITGKSGAFYTVDKFENGIDSASTGTANVYVLMLNFADTLPNGTWIVASESQIGTTGGGNVP